MRCWLTSGKITLIGSLLTVAGRIAPYSCWAARSLQSLVRVPLSEDIHKVSDSSLQLLG
ncbi:MAG: hypothetical protein HQL02_08940 [Nitrospirae bacterium]|nr:hypothetical protein [Nitrospirota bacterium]